MASVASSQQLSAVSRQISQATDQERQLLNTVRWELQKVKAQTERLQGLHGKVDEIHRLLKDLTKFRVSSVVSSVDRFREAHSQTPPKSPTSDAGTQFNDQDGTTDYKPDASETDSQEEEEVQEKEKAVL